MMQKVNKHSSRLENKDATVTRRISESILIDELLAEERMNGRGE